MYLLLHLVGDAFYHYYYLLLLTTSTMYLLLHLVGDAFRQVVRRVLHLVEGV